MKTEKDPYEGVEKLDMTPTWAGLLPVYLEAFEHGNQTGRQAALTELRRMADIADKYVEIVKKEEAEGSTDRVKVIIPKPDEDNHISEEAFSKYINFLAGEMRCFPENLRLITHIDGDNNIKSLSDYVSYKQSGRDLTNDVDDINPTAVNDGHFLVIIPNSIRAVVANGSPLRIYIDKKDIKKFEKQLKTL